MNAINLFVVLMLSSMLINAHIDQRVDHSEWMDILDVILKDPEYLALNSIERLKVINGLYKIFDIKIEKQVALSRKPKIMNLNSIMKLNSNNFFRY